MKKLIVLSSIGILLSASTPLLSDCTPANTVRDNFVRLLVQHSDALFGVDHSVVSTGALEKYEWRLDQHDRNENSLTCRYSVKINDKFVFMFGYRS